MQSKTDTSLKKKTLIVLFVFTLLFLVLVVRVAYIQFVKGDEYKKLAYIQQNTGRTIPATRGTITDTNGNVLAISVAANQITINPKIISTEGTKRGNLESYQKMVADGLAGILSLKADDLLVKVQSSGQYKEIARKIDVSLGDLVTSWIKENKIKGVYVDEDIKRYYPNSSLACHLIGFTGRDNQGVVCGVELALDSLLAGQAGKIITSVDALGNELPYDEETEISPVDGYNVVLTVDYYMQSVVEKALAEATETYSVLNGACCIVMNPNTAEVLAMASTPTFNLNNPYACPESEDSTTWLDNTTESVQILSKTIWRNKAISDTYEPGSTFKSIIAAIALEEGMVTPQSIVTCTPYSLSEWLIRCSNRNGHGDETLSDAVKNSCNPVFAKLAVSMGNDTLYSYLDSFGFLDKTGILLSGEADSIFHENPTDIDRAVTGFGQRVQITPIQLATAYCALANGGYLYKPQILKELTDNDGNVITRYSSELVRQVISNKTAQSTLEMLEGVVNGGTGSSAYVAGYRIAGKTGTSETTEAGHYVASFCAIAPVDDPQLVVLVVLDNPDPNVVAASGGRQAAPVAGKIVAELLEYMGIDKKYSTSDTKNMLINYYVPSLKDLTVKEAIALLKEKGLSYKLVGENVSEEDKVVFQSIEENVRVSQNSKIVIYTSETQTHKQVEVPDLSGLTLDEAYKILTEKGLIMRANCIGKVTKQSIEAGKFVDEGTLVAIDLVSVTTEDSTNIPRED